MRILHLSDIHYCQRYLEEVDRCMDAAVQHAEKASPDLIILSGDLFDHRVELHTDPVNAAVRRVEELARHAPTLILQGTFSHDTPGSLDIFNHLNTRRPVIVADRICQIRFHKTEGFLQSNDWRFKGEGYTPDLLISCLPTTNKAALVAAGEDTDAIGDHVAHVLAGWALSHRSARAAGIPTIVVSHGTVSGSVTEHNVPMAGLDHEYTTGSLFASQADAILLGHIHKHQAWTNAGQVIAYPGSIGRLHFGEVDPKVALLWTVTPGKAEFETLKLPARELIEQVYDYPPTLEALRDFSASIDWDRPVHLRLRMSVDQDFRHAVDEKAIRELFKRATSLKLDVRVNAIQRQRAAGITEEATPAEMLRRWCEYTDTPAAPVLERYQTLQINPPNDIAEKTLTEL